MALRPHRAASLALWGSHCEAGLGLRRPVSILTKICGVFLVARGPSPEPSLFHWLHLLKRVGRAWVLSLVHAGVL